MPSRRRILAASLGGLTSLAGCGCPGYPSSGIDVELSLRSLSTATAGWQVDLDVRTSFTSIDEEASGFPELFVGAYDLSGRPLATAPAGSFTWSDVPEEARESRDCGGGKVGSVSSTLQFVVPELPHAFGLAFPSDASPPANHREFRELRSLVYEDAGTEADWPPETADPDDYRRDRADRFPWPDVPAVNVDFPPSFTDVTLETDHLCHGPSRSEPDFRSSSVSMSIEWSRPIPTDGPSRPFVQSLEEDGREELRCTIGIHDVLQEPGRNCEYRGYRVNIEHEERRWLYPTVVVEHTDATGDVIERRSVFQSG